MTEQLPLKFKHPAQKIRLVGREKTVIELLCQGLAPKEIGNRINPKASRRNVHYYITRVKDKLGARTAWQACAIYGAWNPGIGDKVHESVDGTYK